MGSCEERQEALLKSLIEQKKDAASLLDKYDLLLVDNDLIIHGATIIAQNNGVEYARSDVIEDYYLCNSSSFVFKLIDESIITLYSLISPDGTLLRSSFAFCSCPCMSDVLKDSQLDDFANGRSEGILFNDQITNLSPKKRSEKKTEFFIRDLRAFFAGKCKDDQDLITSMVGLALNPIYLRCDYDSEKASVDHPARHLTMNFIKNSRFRIDADFSFTDFVAFILDAIYGKKTRFPSQSIHI